MTDVPRFKWTDVAGYMNAHRIIDDHVMLTPKPEAGVPPRTVRARLPSEAWRRLMRRGIDE
jgi:hypothetical protein